MYVVPDIDMEGAVPTLLIHSSIVLTGGASELGSTDMVTVPSSLIPAPQLSCRARGTYSLSGLELSYETILPAPVVPGDDKIPTIFKLSIYDGSFGIPPGKLTLTSIDLSFGLNPSGIEEIFLPLDKTSQVLPSIEASTVAPSPSQLGTTP